MLRQKIAEAAGIELNEVTLTHPDREEFGDYSTNIALVLKGGMKLAEEIAGKIKPDEIIENAEAVRPGFLNIRLNKSFLIKEFVRVLKDKEKYGIGHGMDKKRIMVEFAHPNTHKEMHVGHMRTLITGEAVARILETAGAEVFRANYQGDIGPHVAKAIWGTQKLLIQRKISWDEAEKMDKIQKAHLLGEGYILGNLDYETNKEEIDRLNRDLYSKKPEIMPVYEQTRKWSLDYYDWFYSRFGTKFNKLYFESEVADEGVEVVRKNVGQVFTESDGAIVFEGEKYGLHTRVFITSAGTPTYEGKEMALAIRQFGDFAFDKNIHVVANEQAGYFQVVIKALEMMEPKFVGRQYHLSMGMIQLVGRKISSRTGVILTVDGLLDEVKQSVSTMITTPGLSEVEKADILEKVTMAAVKYSVLKTDPTINAQFDIKQSISLEGNSGPYILYTYARTRSVIGKAEAEVRDFGNVQLYSAKENNPEEMAIIRHIYKYSEVVEEAAERLTPNLVANYVYELAGRYNSFYNKHSILSAPDLETKRYRLMLTEVVGQVLANGMKLLGIEVLERM